MRDAGQVRTVGREAGGATTVDDEANCDIAGEVTRGDCFSEVPGFAAGLTVESSCLPGVPCSEFRKSSNGSSECGLANFSLRPCAVDEPVASGNGVCDGAIAVMIGAFARLG